MLGPLELRLARDESELRAAQRLRYRVFYEEMRARPIGSMAAERRDFDAFDDICDHLIVRDTKRSGDEAIVGTYRLLRRSVAQRMAASTRPANTTSPGCWRWRANWWSWGAAAST